jgi:hypothetical protein
MYRNKGNRIMKYLIILFLLTLNCYSQEEPKIVRFIPDHTIRHNPDTTTPQIWDVNKQYFIYGKKNIDAYLDSINNIACPDCHSLDVIDSLDVEHVWSKKEIKAQEEIYDRQIHLMPTEPLNIKSYKLYICKRCRNIYWRRK